MTRVHPTLHTGARKVFEGEIFDVYQWEQELYDGSYATFEKLARPDTASVIAVTEDKKIVLIKQSQPNTPAHYCLPGGRIDNDESAPDAAKRELQEETGYGNGEWSLYQQVTPFHKIDWTLFIYVARNVKLLGPMHHDAGEQIEVLLETFDEFIKRLESGDFTDDSFALHVLRIRGNPAQFNDFRYLLGV